MLETTYQSNIIKGIEAIGGVAINGTYTKSGEADLQCGWPYTDEEFTTLLHLAVEVKTKEDYFRVMKCINSDYTLNGVVGLKKHEPLQMVKIRRNRARGGMSLVAYSFEQVKEYVDGNN